MSSRLTRSAITLAIALASAAHASTAHAQTEADGWAPPPPAATTSSEASFLSGRTLGVGETVIAAALGWPGLWAHVELAPSSTFDLGVRVMVTYGSAVMGLIAGAGGELALPMRVHVFGEGDVDVALRITPVAALGEGRLFGEPEGVRSNDLGLAPHLDVGARIGWRVVERFTIFAGLDAGAGASWTDGENARAIGLFTGTFGVEALMSLETMLFGELSAGAGVADGSGRAVPYYPQQEIFRLSLGLAYVL